MRISDWRSDVFSSDLMGAGIIGWMRALVCGSYLLAWMTIGARWSIVPVLLWHAGFDLLTAADQSAGAIASTVSGIVMTPGVLCAWLWWRQRTVTQLDSAEQRAGARRRPAGTRIYVGERPLFSVVRRKTVY